MSGMQPPWPALKARVSNRLARHFRAEPMRLAGNAPMVSFILPGANSGTINLKFLRATPLINRHIDEAASSARVGRNHGDRGLADLLRP
jgi:hypothetical protein